MLIHPCGEAGRELFGCLYDRVDFGGRVPDAPEPYPTIETNAGNRRPVARSQDMENTLMKSVAVFCGSNFGLDAAFTTLARDLGRAIAEREMTLVYGGGKVGLMGVVADAALAAGGEVIGVIPQALMEKELGHAGVTELIVTGSMHERKARMEQEAEGFIALPGGFGTLDEFCEIVTWAQLGIHAKPCGMLDTQDGFFAKLLAFLDEATDAGFIRDAHREMILHGSDPVDLLDRMTRWTPTYTAKWTEASPTP
jgi:uncharacterized protein (TIGR00730 family)